MELINIPEDVAKALIDAPELGMGYQQGKLVASDGQERNGFFLAGSYFIPEDSADLRGNPAEHDFSKLLLLQPPQPTAWTPAGRISRLLTVRPQPPASISPAVLSAQSSRPPHPGITGTSDVFYRFSAFAKDRRVLPNGSLAPQSYCTSETDKTVVPSGLAAVGRYALPSRISACHVFEVRPGAGFPILFGTVTPNHGLAGGGVEVFFPAGTPPNTVRAMPPLPVK
jgi:hypothetical protein